MLVLAVGGLVWAPYITPEASLLQRVVPASAVTCILAGAAALCSPALHRVPSRPTFPPAA